MLFCEICGSYMNKTIAAGGAAQYECPCCQTGAIPGTAMDTLWDTSLDATSRDTTTGLLKEALARAPFDLAAKCVPIECEKCHRKWMVFVRLPESGDAAQLACRCGAQRTMPQTL